MAKQTTDSQELHEQLEQAKETLNRLRYINGLAPTCCSIKNSKNCDGCQSHIHDITIGKCSDRDRKSSDRDWKCSRAYSANFMSNGESRNIAKSRGLHDDNCASRVCSGRDSSISRVDFERLRRQIDSLEESVREPILSYVASIMRRNDDMSEAVEAIRRQLVKHERACPAMHSGMFRDCSETSTNDSEGGLHQKLAASQKAEKETRIRAEAVEKELEICREKLARSETRVKELFRSISQTRQGSADSLLESQLQRQQQLSENYFKESTSKDREISFLTIEKYNLESEVSSLVADLESSNQKRNEIIQEKQILEISLEESREMIANLEQQLEGTKAEFKRAKSQFRGMLENERALGDKKVEGQSWHEKEIRELRKKIKKYENHYGSRKGIIKHLEIERDELLRKAKSLDSEYKIKLSECKSLRDENQRLTKEISGAQLDASVSKTECNNSKTYIEKLKSELAEAKSSLKVLERSLEESKVNVSRSSAEVSAFSHKETSLRVLIESSEKQRETAVRELEHAKQREVDFKNELIELKRKVDESRGEVQALSQNYASVKTDLHYTREKYLQVKKVNDELALTKEGVEKCNGSTMEELIQLQARYDELSEKNSQLSADLKAYKRIVTEKEGQLKEAEFELTQLHKTKDHELKELLKKDREIAFLKARLTSTERRLISGSDGAGTNRAQTNPTSGQHVVGHASKDAEIYLERIVELESECKAQKAQIDELQKNHHDVKKHVQRSDSLKQELARQDEEVEKLRRELSKSKLMIEELQDKEEKLDSFRGEKEKLRQEVARLEAKVKEVSELKESYEQKEKEMRELKRMSSEEADLEGKVTRLKDRCREKDEEIEELHQKVISLQVKIKDFMQQNSVIEEQLRSVKDKYSVEISEREKTSQTLRTTEIKCRGAETELEEAKAKMASLEKDAMQTKRLIESLETENGDIALNVAKVTAEKKANEEEIEKLRQQVVDLKEAAAKALEVAEDNEDVPDGASTPMDNSLGDSLRFSVQSGRNSAALERLELLEDENVRLLNKQAELEDELDVVEEHAQELKNALKAKRENVNELDIELETMKERLKMAEKARVELADDNEALQRTQVLLKQKIDDLKASNERYIEESDEVEKALTAAETKIEDLEKKLEEVSGRCANSEGHLQSVTERLARKEKELSVVETQVDEQRKLCDGYKASVERQESLVEKLRVEKATADEMLLALRLEMAKKEGTYKSGKEKIGEMQTRLYETEDKYAGKMDECKKLGRENERLKREIKELEIKVGELQSMKKKQMTVAVEKSSSAYNTKFESLSSSVKGNTQNVEGLDTKLSSAQNKISTLEVALANDLRKFSLRRSSSDSRRSGYSPNDNQLSPGNSRRPRSPSSVTGGFVDDRESVTTPRPGSSASFTPGVDQNLVTGEGFDSSKSEIENKTGGSLSKMNFSQNLKEEEENLENATNFDQDQEGKLNVFKDSEINSSRSQDESEEDIKGGDEMSNWNVETALFEADPFLSSRQMDSSAQGLSEQHHEEHHVTGEMMNETFSMFNKTSSVQEASSSENEQYVVHEEITRCSAIATRHTTTATTSIDSWKTGDEELIYF